MQNLERSVKKLIALCKGVSGDKRIVIVGHDMPDADSVISAVMMKRLLSRCRVECEIKLPTSPDRVTLRDMKTLGIWSDSFICALDSDDVLLLVDHHKTFYGNKVLGCVDHHTTPPDPDFDFNFIAKTSSCGKLIYDMMKSLGVADRDDEVLALYSVFLDTQSCRSMKYNSDDDEWVKHCIKEYNIDPCDIENMGFCLNSSDESVDLLATYGYKRYELNGKISASTCIQIDSCDRRWDSIIPSIITHLKAKTASEGCLVWVFVVNKPRIERSDIYFIHNDGVVDSFSLDRLASRSKDVIPRVEELSR